MLNVAKSIDPAGHLLQTPHSAVARSETGRAVTAGSSERAAQRLSVLGEMTGGIAHDFRNILAIIDSGLTLAEKHRDDPRKVEAFVAGAREGVARGLSLTSQLLAFAKQRKFQERPSDANELLKDLELFLKYGAGSAVKLVMELSADLPACLIDPSQFNAAMLNLVVNARDAMPEGGTIVISTATAKARATESAEHASFVRIRVQDNGTGMSDDVLRHLSEPLFTTKGEKGTGLGIPQICAFMRHIGGHVSVASDLGCGTTFDLLFRTAEDLPATADETTACRSMP